MMYLIFEFYFFGIQRAIYTIKADIMSEITKKFSTIWKTINNPDGILTLNITPKDIEKKATKAIENAEASGKKAYKALEKKILRYNKASNNIHEITSGVKAARVLGIKLDTPPLENSLVRETTSASIYSFISSATDKVIYNNDPILARYLYDLIHNPEVLDLLDETGLLLPINIELGIEYVWTFPDDKGGRMAEFRTVNTINDFLRDSHNIYEGGSKHVFKIIDIAKGVSTKEGLLQVASDIVGSTEIHGLVPINDGISENEFPDGKCAFKWLKKYYEKIYNEIPKIYTWINDKSFNDTPIGGYTEERSLQQYFDHIRRKNRARVNKEVSNGDIKDNITSTSKPAPFGASSSCATISTTKVINTSSIDNTEGYYVGNYDMLDNDNWRDDSDDDDKSTSCTTSISYHDLYESYKTHTLGLTDPYKKDINDDVLTKPKIKEPHKKYDKPKISRSHANFEPRLTDIRPLIYADTISPSSTQNGYNEYNITVDDLILLLNRFNHNVIVVDFDNKAKRTSFVDYKHMNKVIIFKVTYNHIYHIKCSKFKKGLVSKYILNNNPKYITKYSTSFDDSLVKYVDDVWESYLKHCKKTGEIITSFNLLQGTPCSYTYTKKCKPSNIPDDFKDIFDDNDNDNDISTRLIRVKQKDFNFETIKPYLSKYYPRYLTNGPNKDDYRPKIKYINNIEDYINWLGIKSTFNTRVSEVFLNAKVLPMTNFIGDHNEQTIDKLFKTRSGKPSRLNALDCNKSYFSIMTGRHVFYSFSIFDDWVPCQPNIDYGHGFYIVEAHPPLPNVTLIAGTILKDYEDLGLIKKKLYFIKPSFIFKLPDWRDLVTQVARDKGSEFEIILQRYIGHYFSGTLLKKYQRYSKGYVVSRAEANKIRKLGYRLEEKSINGHDTFIAYIEKQSQLFETALPIGIAIINIQNLSLIKMTRMITSPRCIPVAWKTDEIIYKGTLDKDAPYMKFIGPGLGQLKINTDPHLPKRLVKQDMLSLDLTHLESTRDSQGNSMWYGNGILITSRAGYGKTYLLNQKAQAGMAAHDDIPAIELHMFSSKRISLLESKEAYIPYIEPGYSFGDVKLRAAFTNAAATLINGITIHSLLGLCQIENDVIHKAFGDNLVDLLVNKKYRAPSGKLYIVIDEILLIPPYLWTLLSIFRDRYNAIFVLAGDLEQISSSNHNLIPLLKSFCNRAYRLTKYRRGDLDMARAHEDILSCKPSELPNVLNRYFKSVPSKKKVRRAICYTNHTRKAFNQDIMEYYKTRVPEYKYIPKYSGPNKMFTEYSQDVILWVGTPVISLYTNKSQNRHASREGYITCLNPLTVTYFDPSSHDPLTSIKLKSFNGWVVNWAVTGIKAQGQTYKFKYQLLDIDIIIKNEGLRANNYVYTMVSRGTSLNNITYL